jgi:hypothetical protein
VQLRYLHWPYRAGLQTLSILSATALALPQLQLPPEISACTGLTSLHLSCAAIPPPMWQLPLRKLTLDQTPLPAAELQQFSRLAALQSLRLCNRSGGDEDLDFGHEVRHLAVSSSLTCLRLDGNCMHHLIAIPAITQLRELDMKRNRCQLHLLCPMLVVAYQRHGFVCIDLRSTIRLHAGRRNRK